MLITLPFQENASLCNEQTWNANLKIQRELDSSYNFHASRFNQFLELHQRLPLLSKEFNDDEIKHLWLSNNASYQQHLEAQIQASMAVVQRIEQEYQAIEPLTVLASKQHKSWLAISRNCQEKSNTINMITSLEYAQLNQALLKDVSVLMGQLNTLKVRYLKEIEVLERSHPKPKKRPHSVASD